MSSQMEAIWELGRQRDGSSELNYACYHDRYQRTAYLKDEWSNLKIPRFSIVQPSTLQLERRMTIPVFV